MEKGKISRLHLCHNNFHQLDIYSNDSSLLTSRLLMLVSRCLHAIHLFAVSCSSSCPRHTAHVGRFPCALGGPSDVAYAPCMSTSPHIIRRKASLLGLQDTRWNSKEEQFPVSISVYHQENLKRQSVSYVINCMQAASTVAGMSMPCPQLRYSCSLTESLLRDIRLGEDIRLSHTSLSLV